ncbi:MAG: hypothetical protein R2864_01550 [Syntrophotaleaceae bacterium]
MNHRVLIVEDEERLAGIWRTIYARQASRFIAWPMAEKSSPGCERSGRP